MARPRSASPALVDCVPASLRGLAGRFSVAADANGTWWLFDPKGTAFYGCGVDGVRVHPGAPDGGSLAAQLRSWHVSLTGPASSADIRREGPAFLESLDCRKEADLVFRLAGVRLPDVFDPRWPAACEARAAAVAFHPGRLALLPDIDLDWGSVEATDAVGLLQACLSLDPRHAAFHAAWEYVLAPYAGDLATLARAWNLPAPHREAVRQLTAEERPLAAGVFLETHRRFLLEYLQRYFHPVREAVRRHAPGTLFFSPPVPAGLRAAVEPWVDVVCMDGDAPAASGGGPVLVTGYHWNHDGRSGGRGRLSALERMHREGRASLEALADNRSVVGYVWSDFIRGDVHADAPFGRGLVYEGGPTAHEYVQPLTALNASLTARHARS